MRYAGNLVVSARPTKSLVIDCLTGCALHEVRAAQAHERSAVDHDDDVRQRREISATRDAWTHHRGNLRHLQITAHDRVVIEDARRAVLPWEYSALIRKIHASRLDEIDHRHA